jgi:hypothetical protein
MIVFRRPDLTRRVFEVVRNAKPAQLIIIADGPRDGNQADRQLVLETRAIFDNVDWDCDLIRLYADSNLGLRARVLTGLDEVFSRVDRALILEDDCLPDPSLFDFASQLLEEYKSEERIALISGNNFAPDSLMSNSYYFSTHANIWGWATWSRTWQEFRSQPQPSSWTENDVERISGRIEGRLKRREFSNLLRLAKSLDSWAISFAAFCYDRHKLSAVPGQNLVTNVGFGEGSTHTKFESYADEIPLGAVSFPLLHPLEVRADLKQMRRESRVKSRRWLLYPLAHPIDFAGRVIRYLRLLKNSESSSKRQ